MTQPAASHGSDPLLRGTAPRASRCPEADAEQARPSPHVSLLVATALGFAYTSTVPLETHLRALATLAEPAPDALEQARAVVLEVEVATAQVRADAAELLHRAARGIVDVIDLGVEPSAGGAALGSCSAAAPAT